MVDYIPEKWRNLRLEYTDEYKNYLKEKHLKKNSLPPPKIMKKPESILKNKSDVNKEAHRLKEEKKVEEKCIDNKSKCVIL